MYNYLHFLKKTLIVYLVKIHHHYRQRKYKKYKESIYPIKKHLPLKKTNNKILVDKLAIYDFTQSDDEFFLFDMNEYDENGSLILMILYI